MASVSLDVSSLTPELQKAYQIAVKAEQKPIQALAEKKANVELKSKLLGDLIGKVEGLRKVLPGVSTPTGIRELASISSDDRVVSATADKETALPGKYSLEVMKLATPSRAFSNGFPDKTETHVGAGYFSLTTVDGEEKEVFVDYENSTLDGLARTINRADLGIKATVINDQSDPDNPFRLVMSGEKAGSANEITYPDFYFLDGEQELEIEKQEAAGNARVRFEGVELEANSNELKDLIPGVNVNLRGISEQGRPVTLTIDQDTPKTAGRVKELVENVNGVLSFIQEQNKMSKDTPHDKTLGGDYGLRLTETKMRSALQPGLLFSEDGRTMRMLGDLGVQFNRNGTLDVDEKKLEKALSENFDEVSQVLVGDGVNGVVPRLKNALTTISGLPGAILTNEKQTFTDRAGQIQRDIDNKETGANRRAEELKRKLSQVQGAISAMQSQQNYLSSQGMSGGSVPGL